MGGKHERRSESIVEQVQGFFGVDQDDHKDWDVAKHGHMADHATGPEDEPATEPWEG